MCNKLSDQVQTFEYRRHGESNINPNVKILSISSKERMFKFTNILLSLLRHGNLIKRRRLLL